MAIVVSLAAGEDQPVDPRADAFVLFRTELSDTHGLHGGDLYSIIVGGEYWALCDALTVITGLKAGDPVDVAWTRMNAQGTSVVDDPWRITYRGDPGGGLRASHGGQFGLDRTVRLRLRVHNPNDYPVIVGAATVARVALVGY